MKIADFKQLCEQVTERADEIMWSKNKDYAGPDGADVMSNFRDMGKDLEDEGICSPGDGMAVVVWVYFKKHLDAVRSFHFNTGVDSEPPIDRVADLYNYMRFMLAMQEENIGKREEEEDALPENWLKKKRAGYIIEDGACDVWMCECGYLMPDLPQCVKCRRDRP